MGNIQQKNLKQSRDTFPNKKTKSPWKSLLLLSNLVTHSLIKILNLRGRVSYFYPVGLENCLLLGNGVQLSLELCDGKTGSLGFLHFHILLIHHLNIANIEH